ncbi:MAG: hypothetical protein KBD37_01490 [Burkholderiales bacterium]|nr:hypothetical protein [Burkholderiales bacterium]
MYSLAVVGNPIEHSLSPLVFNLFAKQCRITLNYTKILAHDKLDFKQKVQKFFAAGGIALNITSPFKHDAYSITSKHTLRSQFCQASNFIFIDNNDDLISDTTDGIGLINDLVINRKLNLAYKNILIIGSGFVVDSILLDLIGQAPSTIDILARNRERINYINGKFGSGIFDKQKQYDLILNTTPNIAENMLFDAIEFIPEETFCYDLTYVGSNSLFASKMLTLNVKSVGCNGIGMLVEQAKWAFVKLFAKVPDAKEVIDYLSLNPMIYPT